MVGVAVLMTIGVYGLVAGIVKLDDLGFWLGRRRSAFARRIGGGIVRAAPWLMKTLSVAGTAAMFLVGGGILVHGVPALHHAVQGWAEGAGALGALLPSLANMGIGVVAGAVVLGAVSLFQRAFGRREATQA
jgi:predicted DNA repair protein MutK